MGIPLPLEHRPGLRTHAAHDLGSGLGRRQASCTGELQLLVAGWNSRLQRIMKTGAATQGISGNSALIADWNTTMWLLRDK